MGTRETDQQLVERAQKGDTRAFDLLVKKYQHKIIGLIGRYVHDHAEVQDVAQEAFLRLWRDPAQVREGAALRGWLIRVASNLVMDRYRTKPMQEIDDGLEIADGRDEFVLPITQELVETAWALRKRFRISYWDAAIIAAAKELGCDMVYSEDLNHGQVYDGVKVINPFV